jgi:hypothetical protein
MHRLTADLNAYVARLFAANVILPPKRRAVASFSARPAAGAATVVTFLPPTDAAMHYTGAVISVTPARTQTAFFIHRFCESFSPVKVSSPSVYDASTVGGVSVPRLIAETNAYVLRSRSTLHVNS